MKTVAISLALGDIYSDGGIGEINKPLDGAVARFEAITKEVSVTEALILCTAGYGKKEPLIPKRYRTLSLAGQLSRYVNQYRQEWSKHLVTKPLCWSTRNEVRVGIKLAQRLGFVRGSEPANLLVSSNASHLIRIRLYTKLYTPKSWKVRQVSAKHQFSLISHLLEIPKIARDIIYSLRVLKRLRSFKRLQTA